MAIAMTEISSAQNSPDLTGTYSLGSHSPEGGSHLIVLENGTFAIAYFGGIIIGQWQLISGNTYRFSMNTQDNQFELFGRHNKDLKDSAKFYFVGFENSETFISLNESNKEPHTLKRVFNAGANCFSYPYAHTFSTPANTISFASIEYSRGSGPVITFTNPKGYNDFVTFFKEQEGRGKSFSATFKNDTLYLEDSKTSQRSPLKEDDEDIKSLKKIMAQQSPADALYLNPMYNRFDKDIEKHHVFDEQKGAFIDSMLYKEGQEDIQSDKAYGDMSILYEYKALKEYSAESVKFKIDDDSLFQESCDR